MSCTPQYGIFNICCTYGIVSEAYTITYPIADFTIVGKVFKMEVSMAGVVKKTLTEGPGLSRNEASNSITIDTFTESTLPPSDMYRFLISYTDGTGTHEAFRGQYTVNKKIQ